MTAWRMSPLGSFASLRPQLGYFRSTPNSTCGRALVFVGRSRKRPSVIDLAFERLLFFAVGNLLSD